MPSPISQPDLDILIGEAEKAASRLWRRLRPPATDLDDLRQVLLTDLIQRLPAFNPVLGTLGAFAGVVLAHQASRIAARALRERRATGGRLLSLELAGGDGASLGDRLSEEGGLAAWHGRPAAKALADRRIDIAAALDQLDRRDRALCVAVAHWSVDRLAACGFGSRTVLYRRLRELQLVLTAHGLQAA